MTEPVDPVDPVEPVDRPDPAGPVVPPSSAPLRSVSRVWGLLARGVSAVAVLGLVAAAAVVGTERPPTVSTTAPLQQVEVPASGASVVCAGPVRVPTEPEAGGDVAYDPQFDPSPVEGSTVQQLLVPEGRGTARPIGEPSGQDLAAAGVRLEEAGTSTVVEVGPREDGVPSVAGASVSSTSAGDLRGLAAASCQRPLPEVWLVGGSTALGSSARLVLSNPGRTPTTVEVELWGPNGMVEATFAPSFLVPPGSDRVVLLEGLAAEQRRLVVHLTASGGLVAAHLQDSLLRGLVPAGVDHVVAGAPPARQQVLSGLSVVDTDADSEDASVLRLLAPTAATTARITVLGPEGEVDLPGTEEVALRAGEVLDVPLAGLAAGTYGVVVDAAEPVVAGAMLTRGDGVGAAEEDTEGLPLERAWVPTTVPAGSGLLALPGRSGLVAVTALPGGGGRAGVRLDVLAADGTSLGVRTVEVPRGRTVALQLSGLVDGVADDEVAGLVMTAEAADVVWSVVLAERREGGNHVAVLAPLPPETAVPTVSVRLG